MSSFRALCRGALAPLAVAGLSLLVFASPLTAQTFTVTTLADSGLGSLREAIETANSDGIPTTITFAPGLAGGTITLASDLPWLGESATTIDGDLDDDCVPDIGLNGANAAVTGIGLGGGGAIVRGLAVFQFTFAGFDVRGSGNVLECNYSGADLALNPAGNANHGVRITGEGSENRIGPGNLFAHNGGNGVRVRSERLPGYPDFTALAADATQVFPTLAFTDDCTGMHAFHRIGDPPPTDGLGRPFTDQFGMRLTGTLSIGTAGTYTFDFRSLDDSARLDLDSGPIELDWPGGGAPPPTLVALAPGDHTIRIDFFENDDAAALELVITGPGSTTLSSGVAPPAGCAASQPGLCGELFQLRQNPLRNRITQNSMFDNGSLGIELLDGCSIANDPSDADAGPNDLLNHPVIIGVTPTGGGLYAIWGTAPADATVELFLSDGDPSGYGEGKVYIGSTTADSGGGFATNLALAPTGAALTATATDTAGNTSEFGPNFAVSAGQDGAAVSGTLSALPGATLIVPVYARDASLTALGADRPAGSRIQSLSYKVTFAPASSVASKLFARAGITAGLTPIFEATPSTPTTASYLGTFDEVTQPIPFTLDAAPPGDQVLEIQVTLAASAPAGTIALTLDPTATLFANQAGSIDETSGNGWLALADGQITVLSNAAMALRAYVLSSSAIQLDWSDPNQNETGFRLERSPDSASWSPVATLGADDTTYLDATGLAPATLYYYRLVTLIPADSQRSNIAAASTFPALAAKVCPQPIATPPRAWTGSPAVAWDGTTWGVAWVGREAATRNEIYFQRFDATTLAPLGTPTRVAASATGADRIRTANPLLAWNGANFGVIWSEGLPGEPGAALTNTMFFALLAPDGSVARGGVRVSSSTDGHPLEDSLPPALTWDGTHWGYFDLAYVTPPMLDLVYRRLDADGDVELGPVTVLAPPAAHVADVDAAWNAATSKYGVLWQEIHNDDIAVFFQVMEEATGVLEGSPTQLAGYFSAVGTFGGSVVADGSGWAVAWTEQELDPDLGEIGVSWMRRFDASGTPLGPATRLSDDPVTDGGVPLLARKLGGGFAAFVSCGTNPYEVCRLETDASGNRIGAIVNVTPADGFHSYQHDVAGNGSDFLVVFQDRGAGTRELGGALVPVSDFSTPGPVEFLTSGHDPNNTPPGSASVVPLGAGFAAVWLDPTSGTNWIQARIWNGSGATVAILSPLTSTPSRGQPAVTAVGSELAVAWRDVTTNDLWFARYDATGTPLIAETSVSTLDTSASIAMDFSGELYGLLRPRGGGFNFLRVAPDGSTVGTDRLIPVGNVAGPVQQMRWVGGGWAVVWRSGDNNLHYALLAPDGSPLVLNVQLTAATQNAMPDAFHLIWTGLDLGLAWSELRDLDPPLDDIYFVRLGLDGAMAFPPVAAVSTAERDLNPQLYWTAGDARFHLVHAAGGIVGAREIELQTDGAVLPGERYWANRDAGPFAWNGVTLGYLISVDSNLYFETGACVTGDASAPPCPALSVASFDNLVRLAWDPVTDPESGVFRYQVYRDGLPLGQTVAATTQFDDAGFAIGATHAYELRALNGAWNESDACPAVAFSTAAGDANGDGSYGAADIFYLINFFFADGPPPLGNADANGDNTVSVTDIFYMINNLYSGGPYPVPIAGGDFAAAAPVVTETALSSGIDPKSAPAGRQVRSRLIVGSATAAPGATVRIPIDLVDRPDTPLGPERPLGERVQALALAVACSPCDGIAGLTIEPAGALIQYEPLFESRPAQTGQAALVTTYDEARAPLFLGLSSSRLRQRVATLVVRLTPSAPAGTTLDLRLDPGTTLLSNQAGTLYESVPNGWLELTDGRLAIGLQPVLDNP